MALLASHFDQIKTPTLLLNEAQAQTNIAAMAQRAAAAETAFRPHFKTHQSAGVGEWFKTVGVTAVTVSSVAMAYYFAAHGWRDITIAFPLNLREIDDINRLASQIDLGLLVDSLEAVDFLAERLDYPVRVWLEIDPGYQRSGAFWSDTRYLRELGARLVATPQCYLQGVLCHAGNTYGARSLDGVRAIHEETVTRMAAVRETLADVTARSDLQISIGDTPACSMLDDWGPVNEIRPGNFVFFDLTQQAIGACTAAEIAVAVACPVVGIYPDRHEIVIYGGAIHLSKEGLTTADGAQSFGAMAPLHADGWGEAFSDAYVRSVSQEHGIVRVAADSWTQVADTIKIGDLVAILPVHSCLAANLLKRYLTLDGQRLDMAPIPR